jgi:16S rRNA (guanine(966)-N(2))-methyltransferase RsmD
VPYAGGGDRLMKDKTTLEMRIISGKYKGRIINPPRNLRARPTTDFAKENLFNVLAGMVDIEECDVLDLFAGTGSVSYEFASRGARSVTAVEINAVHYGFIRRVAGELGFTHFFPVKANVFNYLRACTRQFDIIFSDAPYDLAGSEEVVSLVFERGLLRPAGAVRDDGTVSDGGLLIFEHSKGRDFSAHPNFLQMRSYGSVQFSMFGVRE